MKKLRAAAIGCLLAGSTAHAAPPLELKGYAIGAKKTPAIAHAVSCGHDFVPGFDTCIPNVPQTIAGVEMNTFSLQFHGDVLKGISGSFSADHFDDVLSALKSKYGVPKITAGEVSNAMGAKFDDVIAAWDHPNGGILLKKRAGKIDRSMISVSAKDMMSIHDAAEAEELKRRAADL
ncbi:MAG: hypothetical protein ACPHN2_08835 [Sinimarinibacterium flocculans]|uniref:hypothetical protein n=1 Tax=Sinimarinibacterium flocculans TaxID=985250 RepID=UPI003C4FB8DC